MAKSQKIEVYSAADTLANDWARILLLGSAKSGKSVACARTSPKPILVLNCDGKGALTGPANLGADFNAINVTSTRSWGQAIGYAMKEAQAEKVQTVVVDTISLLAETLVDELSEYMDGYDLWGRIKDELVGGIRDLMSLDAHLIVVGHAFSGEDGLFGVMPAIPGKSATRIPAMLSDWVWLNLDGKSEPPKREFFIGPQGKWTHGCRNAKKSSTIDADVTKLIKTLGMEP